MNPLECPTMMMRSDSEKLISLIERTFVTSSHVAATPAIHVPIMSLQSYGKSLKKEKHHKQNQSLCQIQSRSRSLNQVQRKKQAMIRPSQSFPMVHQPLSN